MTNILPKIDNILNPIFKNQHGRSLEEPKANMSISIMGNMRFLSYSFDKKIKEKTNASNIFPFFNNTIKGTCSMCDYVLFCPNDGKLFILLIELKKSDKNVTAQLNAGKCFVNFIISTLNRIESLDIKPEIRLISIRDYNIVRKGSTSPKKVEYDKDNFYTFQGKNFFIKEFLK